MAIAYSRHYDAQAELARIAENFKECAASVARQDAQQVEAMGKRYNDFVDGMAATFNPAHGDPVDTFSHPARKALLLCS